MDSSLLLSLWHSLSHSSSGDDEDDLHEDGALDDGGLDDGDHDEDGLHEDGALDDGGLDDGDHDEDGLLEDGALDDGDHDDGGFDDGDHDEDGLHQDGGLDDGDHDEDDLEEGGLEKWWSWCFQVFHSASNWLTLGESTFTSWNEDNECSFYQKKGWKGKNMQHQNVYLIENLFDPYLLLQTVVEKK